MFYIYAAVDLYIFISSGHFLSHYFFEYWPSFIYYYSISFHPSYHLAFHPSPSLSYILRNLISSVFQITNSLFNCVLIHCLTQPLNFKFQKIFFTSPTSMLLIFIFA